MPQYTSNMNLYKVDLETDGNSTFNIMTMLNDNWDKIDSNYDEQEGRIRGNSEVVNEVKEDVGDKSELKTEDKSSLVGAVNEVSSGMADIANEQGDLSTLQTTEKTNLVGAMNELFQSADSGKTNIKNKIQDVDSSVLIPSNPTFNDLVTAIGNINTGKKWATGTLGDFQAIFDITDLSFTPSIVILNGHSSEYYYRGMIEKPSRKWGIASTYNYQFDGVIGSVHPSNPPNKGATLIDSQWDYNMPQPNNSVRWLDNGVHVSMPYLLTWTWIAIE